MNTIKTAACTIAGEKRLRAFVSLLIDASQWFVVTPLPDDLWQIEVKIENATMLVEFGKRTASVRS